MIAYVQFLRNKNGATAIQDAVTTYLPVYGIWAAIVTFSFPLIFKI
jgi:Flp pilus assembly pilin Flp